MRNFIAERLCHLCSFRSIELKQFGKTRDGIRNSRTYQASNSGLTCTSCNGFVCIDCIKLLTPKMEVDAKHHLDLSILEAFRFAIRAKSPSQRSPPNYIGHCCILARPTTPKKATSSSRSSDLDSCSIMPARLTTTLNFTTRPRLSGCIHFPEFGVFIDSPIDCMDIHAVGAESRFVQKNKRKRNKLGHMKPPSAKVYLPARWHRVIPHTYAIENDYRAPKIKAPLPQAWKTKIFNNIKIKEPHCQHTVKVSSSFLNMMVSKSFNC